MHRLRVLGFDVKIQYIIFLLFPQDLQALEEEICERLFPLTPTQRHDVFSDHDRKRALFSSVGDCVWSLPDTSSWDTGMEKREVGMIQYIGPLHESANGAWFGVELVVSSALLK